MDGPYGQAGPPADRGRSYSRVEKKALACTQKMPRRKRIAHTANWQTVGQPPLPRSLLPSLPTSLLPLLPPLPPSLVPLLLLPPPPPPPPPPPTPTVVKTQFAEDPRRPALFPGWDPRDEVHGVSLLPWRPLITIDIPGNKTRDKATQTDAPLPPPPPQRPPNTSAVPPRPQNRLEKPSTGSPKGSTRRRTCIVCSPLPMATRKRTRPRLVTSTRKGPAQ
ncbi:PREDICTED: WAS/WASL-interacting protein family member 3-like [Vollenhovia emeryi]|uniref:WAS/WASL-interacting protein family member 3-like n=1 Tax=Vollenhovia emeryi TaxID=411798 RepID=UPI0005F40D92|nr:PREDICTED: WAS/WASL-interacting protein family member 3-like [Vollenhovia emeryi]